MSMVEKVARALVAYQGFYKWEELPETAKDHVRGSARAVIKAMREPSHGMVDVGTEARWRSAIRDADSVREIWQAMIDAALAESKEG